MARIVSNTSFDKKNLLLHFFKLIPDVVYVLDTEGKFIFLNQNFQKTTGWKSKDWIGKSFKELIHPEDLAAATGIFKRVISGKKSSSYELRIKSSKGDYLIGKFTSAPFISNGKIVGKIGIGHDITQSRVLESNLRLAIRKLHELYLLSSAISRSSTDTNELYKNALKSIQRILGVEKASFSLLDQNGQMYFKSWINLSKKYRKELGNYNPWAEPFVRNPKSIFIPSVEEFPFENNVKKSILNEGIKSVAFFPLTFKNTLLGRFGLYYTSPHQFSKDEMELGDTIGKHISLALSRRKNFEVLMSGIADGLTIQDSKGNLVYANEAAAISSGYQSVDEMLKNPTKWINKFEIKNEKGELIDLNMLPGRQALDGQPNPSQILQFKNKKKGEIRWSQVQARPIYDELGKVEMAVNVIHDITDRLELERRKDAFISAASHELKTPLAVLKGFTQILSLKSKDILSQYYLKKMDDQINRLEKLVKDLLDLSKIQSGKLELEREKFSLSQLVRNTAEDMQQITPTHKIITKNLNDVNIWADKDRLSQVLVNLLSNAIKFSPKGQKVVVNVKKNHKIVTIKVRDFGIGIHKKNMNRIFEPFFQAENTIRQSFSGLGLGLAISSHIIKRHKGEILVESQKGRGTTFLVKIPLKA